MTMSREANEYHVEEALRLFTSSTVDAINAGHVHLILCFSPLFRFSSAQPSPFLILGCIPQGLVSFGACASTGGGSF